MGQRRKAGPAIALVPAAVLLVDPGGPQLGRLGPAPPPPQRTAPPFGPPGPPGAAGEVSPTWCGDEDGLATLYPPQEGRGVAARYTWSELSVDGDALAAARGEPVAFFAPAGSTAFERVELPGGAGTNPGPVLLEADDEGFDLLVGSGGTSLGDSRSTGMMVLRSDDGRSWAAGPGLSGLGWTVAGARLNGRLTVVGDSNDGAVVARSDGAGGWTSSPLSAVVDAAEPAGRFHVFAADVGPLGIVVAGVSVPLSGGAERGDRPPLRLLVSRDGVTWSDEALDELAGQPLEGVTRVEVDGQRAIVTANLPRAGSPSAKPSPSRQITLVGTLS